MPNHKPEKEPTYADVAELVMEMRANFGRSTTYRLDPDFYKANEVELMRYWVVAECWATRSDKTHTESAGWWFRGGSGAYTMAAAMYYSLTAVYYRLAEQKEQAEAQSSF